MIPCKNIADTLQDILSQLPHTKGIVEEWWNQEGGKCRPWDKINGMSVEEWEKYIQSLYISKEKRSTLENKN